MDNLTDMMARACGFDNDADLRRLVSMVDVSTSQKLAAFEQWNRMDGTKTGLLRLFPGASTATKSLNPGF